MSNELNLQTARFTRTNPNGVAEPQKMGIADLGASWKRMASMVNFEGFANAAALPIKHNLNIQLDPTKPSHQTVISLLSLLIWEEAMDIPFIDDYELIDGAWVNIPKSLNQLGALMEDVDLTELMKNAGRQ